MASFPIFNASGSEVGTYDIDASDIATHINRQLLHDVVVMYEANQRQGSHCAKTRGEVSGSTKKLYRQKGTGNARAGSKRTNVRRGGGVARTIKPRDYSYRLPKKAIKLATRMAIASKVVDGEIVIIDDFGLDGIKTKAIASSLQSLGLAGLSTLIVLDEADKQVYLSARNIAGVTVSPVRELNALSVLKPRRLLVLKSALDRIKDGTFAAAPGVAEEAA